MAWQIISRSVVMQPCLKSLLLLPFDSLQFSMLWKCKELSAFLIQPPQSFTAATARSDCPFHCPSGKEIQCNSLVADCLQRTPLKKRQQALECLIIQAVKFSPSLYLFFWMTGPLQLHEIALIFQGNTDFLYLTRNFFIKEVQKIFDL